MGGEFEHRTFRNGPIELHVVLAGPSDGPAVVLLHGFPEFWYGWHRQIEPLAAAGFRVIVPDQRGYNLSSQPQLTSFYRFPILVSDIIAIADQLGLKRFYVAGHDWGAMIAWGLALLHPERIAAIGILNGPHPAAYRRIVRANARQMIRSWYAGFFQLPVIPEALLAANDFTLLASSMEQTSRAGTFQIEDMARYREAWRRPGALTSMINWYRAAARYGTGITDPQVRVPTRMLWGAKDQFLLKELAAESMKYCRDGELTMFPEATHWLQHEEADAVSTALIDYFKKHA